MKHLSETHPTLNEKIKYPSGTMKDLWLVLKEVQDCTVDVAEHERVKELHDLALRSEVELLKEVERLKKEHAQELMYAIHQAEKMGERRAMKRVKETIYKVSKEIYWEGTANEGKKQILRTLLDELGLGEEK